MKGLKRSGLFFLLCLGMNAVYADNVCSSSPDAVHCAGMSGGVPEDTGKYIFVEWVNSDLHAAEPVCANNRFSVFLDNDDVQKALKNGVIKGLVSSSPVGVVWRFWQCSDAQCTSKKLLGVDGYKISVANDKQNFTANPNVYNIPALDSTYGKTCTPPAIVKQDLIKKMLVSKK